ncbi:MAG: hypothetical protein VKJ24_06340 [Synechococcales bacterium]|nr:hypothetical protein [Synechococcales bacterium]
MVQAFIPPLEPTAPKPMSLEEFLAWDEGSDRLYELIEGMPMQIYDPTADHEARSAKTSHAIDLCDG